MSYTVQKVTEPVALGEGPHWHDRQQALYFVSLPEKTIHKYVPATGKHTKATLHGRTSFIIPVEGTSHQFAVSVERTILLIQWDGEDGSEVRVLRELAEVDKHEPNNCFNDGKADPRGRLYAGTLNSVPLELFQKEKGSLYRIETGKPGGIKIEPLVNKISVANGLSWDLKEKAFYYTDSLDFKIRRYDYDVETGNICNQTFVFELDSNDLTDGLLDGHTIDTDGNLWIAVFNRSCVIKLDPRTGTVLEKIPIPAKQVTSCTFGGANLDVLFVTSGNLNLDGEQLSPLSGSTFMVTGLGVTGHPNINFKLY